MTVTCLDCGAQLACHTRAGSGSAASDPSTADTTGWGMCPYCGTVYVLGPDGVPGWPTAGELAAIQERKTRVQNDAPDRYPPFREVTTRDVSRVLGRQRRGVRLARAVHDLTAAALARLRRMGRRGRPGQADSLPGLPPGATGPVAEATAAQAQVRAGALRGGGGRG